MGYKEYLERINSKKNDRNKSLKKVLLTVFMFNFIQLILLIIFIMYGVKHPESQFYHIIYIFTALITLNAAINALAYYFLLYKKNNIGIIETVNNLEQLNRKLREQRHDYLNHIQVIYGLMELDEFEEAKKYIEPVYKDIVKVSRALKTSKPAVNALLQAKTQMAEKHGIDMFLDIRTNLKKLPIESWEFCKVISNIIDNGITALQRREGNRNITIDMGEDLRTYYIHIYNNGPKIEEQYIDKIFIEGFTTKKQQDHGIGLYIAKSIIEEAKGSINVASDSNRTCFNITIPKYNKV